MVKTPKKHSKGKDLPRYSVVLGYEKAFKKQYAKFLGETIIEILAFLSSNDTNTSANTGTY